MNRRNFLSKGSILAAATPLFATKAIMDFARDKKEPLPELEYGSALTAEFMNELTARVNDLENRI